MSPRAPAPPTAASGPSSGAPRAWRAKLRAGLRRIAPALLAAALLLLPPLLLLAPVTLGGRTMVPFDALLSDPVFRPELLAAGIDRAQNALVADLVFQNLVWKDFLAQSLAAGEVPLWNPYLAGGMPFLAAGQHAALYPLTLLFLFLSPERAFGWNAFLNLWLAGLLMYAFGRTLRLGRFAALIMGLAWSASTLFVANNVFPMIQAGMTWLPLILAGIAALTRDGEAAREDPEAGELPWLPRGRATAWLIVIALAALLGALAGHPEILYYNALVAAAFAAYRLLWLGRERSWAAAGRVGLWLVGAAAAGALLAGIQLLPQAELAGASFRAGRESYAEVAGYAFGWRQAITFLVPDFYGNPAHHAVPALGRGPATALAGDAAWGGAWGAKNYVESAAYLGLLVPLLALVGLADRRRRRLAAFFGGLALVALSFVFGLPSYRLLFFGLPGFDQLHTPFRWVFPYALSLVVLAGLGADRLARGRSAVRLARLLGVAALGLGTLAGLGLAIAWRRPEAWTEALGRLFARLPGALDAALAPFPHLAALAAYQYWNLVHLALFASLAGLALLLLAQAAATGRDRRPGFVVAGLALLLDLVFIGYGFTPALDRELARMEPPALRFLADAADIKWGRVTAVGEGRMLWPNSAMRAGLSDLRAYDSILPESSVAVLDAVQDQDGWLRYNRLGNLGDPSMLRHPALAMLGARYVLAAEDLEDPELDLIHESGAVRVYENRAALDRAWVVNAVTVVAERPALLAALANLDPRSTVLLETVPDLDIWQHLPAGRSLPAATAVRADTEKRGSFEVDVFGAPSGGLLVLSEAWFPGWRAWVEVSGSEGRSEREVPVYRANGMLRAVPVPPGRSTVRLQYFPMSVKVGLYASFLGLILLILAVAYALWERYVRVEAGDELRRVAVNTAGPVAANLLNKAVDFAFAMLMLRVLGPALGGQYYTAMVIIGFADIFTNFGLNLLVARDIARRPEEEGRYLTHSALLRMLLWLAMVPGLAAYVLFRAQAASPATGQTNPLPEAMVWALALFALGLIPSNLNAAIGSVFQARERMVLPAGVSIVSTLLKVSVGALVLLGGMGYVGLAGVSILTNWLTFAILAALAWRHGIRPQAALDRALLWLMLGAAFPLMLNHLLQTVFFKIDVLLLDQLLPREGDTVVGWYSAAYKWIDALLILPAFFTMALFPLMSRRAAGDRAGLARAWVMGQRWLLSFALPVAVATTFLAESLVRLLAGAEFVPEGGTALAIMIWFLPLSFANGLTQYVLIAIDRARWITISFAIAVAFNVVANWLVIPGHSFAGFDIPRSTYVGAALVTILSELVLRLPFGWGLRDLEAPPFLVILWRPALAAAGMALLAGGLVEMGAPALLALALGLPLYAGVLLGLGGVTAEDRALLGRLRGRAKDEPSAPVAGPVRAAGS